MPAKGNKRKPAARAGTGRTSRSRSASPKKAARGSPKKAAKGNKRAVADNKGGEGKKGGEGRQQDDEEADEEEEDNKEGKVGEVVKVGDTLEQMSNLLDRIAAMENTITKLKEENAQKESARYSRAWVNDSRLDLNWPDHHISV